MLTPGTSAMFARSGMLAPDGRCKTLAGTADGYGRGEACATLLLRLHAVVEGDTAPLMLMGSAVNQDGRSSSLTAPNGPAQQRAIRAALLVGHLSGQARGSQTPQPADPICDAFILQINSLDAMYKKYNTATSWFAHCVGFQRLE